MRLIAKACLIRRKTLSLLGRKNEAETERLGRCPQVIWKSVPTAQAYERFGVGWRDQAGASVSAAPSQGHCLVQGECILSVQPRSHCQPLRGAQDN